MAHCQVLALSQKETSTTHPGCEASVLNGSRYGSYFEKLDQFQAACREPQERDSAWKQPLDAPIALCLHFAGSSSVFAVSLRLPPQFREVVKAARSNPAQAGVRHICASLYVYSDLMIDGFVEQSSNYVHLFLVQALAEQLEQVWRVAFSGNFSDLFPKDEGIARERQSLEEKLKKLSDAKARSTTCV